MLIGINGFKGAGKSTVGEYIAKHHGFELASFAALLKESAAQLFGIPVESWEAWKNQDAMKVKIVGPSFHGARDINVHAELTVREFLQRYGTEAHRDVFGDNFWVDAAFNDFEVGQNLVFTDARFDNELRAIKLGGGFNIRVIRPGYEGEGHASEQKPDPSLIDGSVFNNGTIEQLQERVDWVMNGLLLKTGLMMNTSKEGT